MTGNIFDLTVKVPPLYDSGKSEGFNCYNPIDAVSASLDALSLQQLTQLQERLPLVLERKIALEAEDAKDNKSIAVIWGKLAAAISQEVPEHFGLEPLAAFNSWFIAHFNQLVPLMGIATKKQENAFLAEVLACRHFNKVRQQVVNSAFEEFAGYRSTLVVWRRLALYIQSNDRPKRDELASYSFEECKARAAEFPGWFQRNVEQLSALKKVRVQLKNITTLPSEVYTLEGLEELHLWDNQLTRVPAAIGKLKNLKIVGLGKNQISSLDRAIGDLVNLEQLFLGENRLEVLPEELANCGKLRRLNVNENLLSGLPKEFKRLSSHVWIVVDKHLELKWWLLDAQLQWGALKAKMLGR